MIAYRICERRGDKLMTLFHPLNGTRVLPVGQWLNADIKPVRDGSRRTAKEYISGFHVLQSKNECRAFIKKFRAPRDLVMVKCEVDGIRRKIHSRENVLLVDKIKLISVEEKLYF